MSLLGVASVCKLDFSGFSDGAGKVYEATVETLEIATKMKDGAQSVFESGQGIWLSVKGGILSGGRQLWYTALREAQEHVQNGRLTDFNHLVFAAPCHAIDSLWDVTNRQQAVCLLAELYKNESIRSPDEGIDKWILIILRQVSDLPDSSIFVHAQTLLQGLENEGNASKQTLYRDLLSGPPNPPSVVDVDYDLRRLRGQRLKGHENALYIPPQAKPTLQSPDDTLFPLMEKALEFLAGPRQPAQDLIGKQLRNLNFKEDQIHEFKQHREFIVICDGYDESQLKPNLYATNQLNQSGQWKAKVVISCRSQYLGSDYRSRFQPQATNRYDRAAPDLFQEAVIASFTKPQIQQYVQQYVKRHASHNVPQNRSPWTVEEYMEKLVKIPNLIDLVSNPFLLSLSLEALPEVINSHKDLSTIRITRVELYDGFVKQWLEINRTRLESSPLSDSERSALDRLVEDDFVYHGIRFQKDLSAAIFKEQAGLPVVRYVCLRDSDTWKASFFHPEGQVKLLRESSTVTRTNNDFRFIHRSLLEYFYSRTFYDPLESGSDAVSDERPTTANLQANLSQRSLIGEPSVLQFLAERVEQDPSFQKQLLGIVELSKTSEERGQAAANAISILIKARVRFNGADLRGIRIPDADIRGGQFDSANFEGADLTDVNLGKAWLRKTNLSKTQMAGVKFGELPYLRLDGEVFCCVFSSDGKLLAVAIYTGTYKINIYDTTTWERVAIHQGRYAIAISPLNNELAKETEYGVVDLGDIFTGESRLVLRGHDDTVTCISYSSDGAQIAISSKDTTVRIWSTQPGTTLHVLKGHSHAVWGVAFSPTNPQLVSCGQDKTVRTWDAITGKPLATLEDHTDFVHSVTYSPDGRQIASGGHDSAVRLWDAHTGELHQVVSGHIGSIYGVAYSRDGYRLASGGYDNTIRLWDPLQGDSCGILLGHGDTIYSVAYSPTGEYIASGGKDKTVRLWEAGGALDDTFSNDNSDELYRVGISPDGTQIVTGDSLNTVQLWEVLTGKPGISMRGHTDDVHEVAFSPRGLQIVSASNDCTVRLWNARTGTILHVLVGHTGTVFHVAYSPCGDRVVSGSADETVRLWNTQTGKLEFALEGHSDVVNGVAYSPSGDKFTSCSDDATVRLWCAQTGECLFVLYHPSSIFKLEYSPDGHHLISVLIGERPICWDPRSGERVERMETISKVVCFCFAPESSLVVTVDRGGLLQLWGLATDSYSEVYRCMIGLTLQITWKRSFDRMVLATISATFAARVWSLVQNQGTYDLQLIRSVGTDELSMYHATLDDIVGLSPVNLALLKQRVTIEKPEHETSGEESNEESSEEDEDEEKNESRDKEKEKLEETDE
ncbi:hypothetical protein BGX29_012107 [Mortierella sp. GBA35]|nr:hypothetical protein BGX29_012107 [Mortierella sp. GBA35]